MFLEECKDVVKKKIPGYITNHIEIFSNDSVRKHSDEQNCNEENLKKNVFNFIFNYFEWF